MSGLDLRVRAARQGSGAATPPGPLDEAEFLRFQDFFYRKTGIIFGAAKRYFVDRRLTERIAAIGAGSLREFLRHLKFDDPEGVELQHLINAMTVNETYFYREEYQFRCLTASILPELVAARPRSEAAPFRIWSLPCSTGEEPYSIAIQLLGNWPDLARYDVQIIGSDIDSQVIARARAGRYDSRAVQHLSPALRQQHFTHLAEDRWQISDELRASVEFTPINLNDRRDMRRHQASFDVIFCRNLLIYFDDLSRRQAAEALFEALRPGGFLCLGHSESMSRISALFTIRKFPDAIVYQKPKA